MARIDGRGIGGQPWCAKFLIKPWVNPHLVADSGYLLLEDVVLPGLSDGVVVLRQVVVGVVPQDAIADTQVYRLIEVEQVTHAVAVDGGDILEVDDRLVALEIRAYINEQQGWLLPDANSGEAVKLFVVKKDPAVTEQDLMKFAAENLTGYKKPKYIEFRSDLPKTNVGKILRRELRDMDSRTSEKAA